MLKKRGFTLVELLVAIAITTLLFAMIGGTYIFMAQSQGNLLDKSSELFFAQEIADYLKNNPNAYHEISVEDGSLWYNKEKVIFKNINLESCSFTEGSDFITCKLVFTNVHKDKSNHTYIFILGEIPTT